jgi:EF hand
MKTTPVLFLSSAVLALSASLSFAQSPGSHFFETWDANSDGAVTLAEAEERRTSIFASFDANEDGFLVLEETKLMDEMQANEQKTKQDGKGHGMGQGKGNGQGKGMGKHAGGGEAGHGPNGHMGFDTDGDGKVSKAEFIGTTKDWFAKFDSNSDGSVTSEDF